MFSRSRRKQALGCSTGKYVLFGILFVQVDKGGLPGKNLWGVLRSYQPPPASLHYFVGQLTLKRASNFINRTSAAGAHVSAFADMPSCAQTSRTGKFKGSSCPRPSRSCASLVVLMVQICTAHGSDLPNSDFFRPPAFCGPPSTAAVRHLGAAQLRRQQLPHLARFCPERPAKATYLSQPVAAEVARHCSRRAGAASGLTMQTGYTFGVEDLNLTPGARVFLVGADILRSRYKTLEETWDLQVCPADVSTAQQVAMSPPQAHLLPAAERADLVVLTAVYRTRWTSLSACARQQGSWY